MTVVTSDISSGAGEGTGETWNVSVRPRAEILSLYAFIMDFRDSITMSELSRVQDAPL